MIDDEFIAQLSQHERLLHSISVTFARGDAEEEKDIYQEILYNLWRTRDRYNGQCSIKNWLYRVGLNTAISLWRQEKKRVQTTPITPLMEETVADEPSAPLYDELYRLIDLLPKDDQALVFLYIDGATEEEMASVLGISQTNVGVRIHRVKPIQTKILSVMEDILDQLRDNRLAQTPKWQREININDLSAHNKAHAAYDHLRWRLNWGLPGSIVLMLVVAALAPYYVHSLPYFVCYAVVQLITIVRVMIAVQMYIAIRHLDPTRPVAEVNAYADRMTLLQRFNHHYTLYIKLPLTVCLGPLFGPPMGFDFFSYKWVLYLWIVLCVVLLSLNAWGIVRSFRKLDAAIENIKNNN